MRAFGRDGQYWKLIGQLDKIAPIVYAITKVDLAVLRKEKTIKSYSFAQRLSWAANRTTTKPEDLTYCLLGILDVSLEVKYGIGQAAFQELQRKLLESGGRGTTRSLPGNATTGMGLALAVYLPHLQRIFETLEM